MSLRSRISEVVTQAVEAHAPQCLHDLWGRHSITVVIPVLNFKRSGQTYLAATGKIRVQLITEHPENLPGESLWLALSQLTIPALAGKSRHLRLMLDSVTEEVDVGWCMQSIDFSIEIDLVGV